MGTLLRVVSGIVFVPVLIWLSQRGGGFFLYLVMNLVVVPLSAARPGSRDPVWIGLSVAVHMLLIGIPIALFVRQGLVEAEPEVPGAPGAPIR